VDNKYPVGFKRVAARDNPDMIKTATHAENMLLMSAQRAGRVSKIPVIT